MTKFQFSLIMRTLLAIFYLKLNERSTNAWEKSEKQYEDLKGMFSLWQHTEEDEF